MVMDGTQLTFPLRQGVKWHDGKPFTARDVKCTWDLLTGKSSEKFRLDPRKSWYRNLAEVTTNGDYEVTFRLERPQPAFIALLASGYSVVYPCHVPPGEMRQHPIGTGPFKFVEFRPNERITLARNQDYWKKGRPYLDGVEFTIIRDVSTANLASVAGKLDWIATTIPTSNFTRTTPAVPHATTPVIATPNSKSCSTGNQWKPTKASASGWCGRPKRNWRKTVRYRSNRFAYCWQPHVKDWTMMVNSIINNWRIEDVWLDR
jgi:ABC-type transport system substrate-binding protein